MSAVGDTGFGEDDAARRLEALEQGTTAETAMAFFDALPAATLDAMTGTWLGRGVPTGHPLDGMLERFGWYGKRFQGGEDAHPLVFADGRGGLVSIRPVLVPIGLVRRFPRLVNAPLAAQVFRLLRPLLATRKPMARLRMVEHRGVVTATMIYDALPINDVFRRVDDDTVLGLMDLRGMERPFFFSLRRDGRSA